MSDRVARASRPPSGRLVAAALLAGALLGHGLIAAEPWATEQEAQQEAEALRAFFAGNEIRYLGSPGNFAMEEKIAQLFAASSFKQFGAIKFQAPHFVPGKATLSVEGAGAVSAIAMHPTAARPGNFEEKQFEAPLVYLGRGSVDDLAAAKGVQLDGAIALMEFNCSEDWMRLMRFGLKGFIFIGAEDYEPHDARAKVYITEVATPRYFVSAADGEKLKGALKAANAPLKAKFDGEPSRWKNSELRNPWVLIPGHDASLNKEVVVITAPIDANCVVPELAEGAQNGANLFLLTRLLEHFKQEPPARSVLLVALNAHTQSWLGERMLSWHLLAPQTAVEDVRNLIGADIRLQQMYRGHYQKLFDLLNDPARQQEAEDFISQLRELQDDSTGKQLSVKDKIVSRIRSDVGRSKTQQLERYQRARKAGVSLEDAQKDNEKARKERETLVDVLRLFNKWGHRTKYLQLHDEQKDLLKSYVKSVLDDNTRKAELNKLDLDRDQANGAIRQALAGRSVRYCIALELNFRNRRIGLASGHWAQEWRHKFGGKMVEAAKNIPGVRAGKENLFTDTLTFSGGLPESHYFPATEAPGFFHVAGPTPAFSLQNAFAQLGSEFTPADTFAKIPAQNVAEILRFAPHLLSVIAAADATVLKNPDLRKAAWSIQIKVNKFDEFSPAVMPEIEVPSTLVTLQQRHQYPIFGDVITPHISLTDERATAMFYGMKEWLWFLSTAMQLDADFTRVLHTIDAGDKEGSLTSNVTPRLSQTIVMFPCKEYRIVTREDPTLIGTDKIKLVKLLPLDSRRGAQPRQFGLAGAPSDATNKRYTPLSQGPLAVFMPEKQQLKLLRARSELLGINADESLPEGTGFESDETLGTDLFERAAHDSYTISNYRLGRLSGVSQELARDYLKQSKAALDAMDNAAKDKDHIGYLQSLYTGLGAGRQAYAQVADITNDMLRAVVFYMALIIPFCFFMQKLLFNFVKIEAQIGMFFFMFIGSYLVFRQIHPAFAIAKSPEGILIAFVMGSLGAFVVSILHGRFEGEMQLLFRNYAGDVSEIGYSTVGQKAMLIGVNNMRRRRVRTALTTATIVLVTFTMLSFTSISSKVSPTVVAVTRTLPPYSGIMFHMPGKRMDESSMKVFREMFHGKGEVVVRRWLLPPPPVDRVSVPFHAEAAPGKYAKLDGVLGLPMADKDFLGPMPLLAGRYFSSDDADEVIVPSSLMNMLGLDLQNFDGAKLNFMSRHLTVVGILDDEKFRLMQDLDGLLLLPQKESASQDVGGVVAGGGETGAMVSGSEQTGFYVEPSALLLMPVERSLRFGAQAYSVSVKFAEDTPMWPTVLNVLTVTQAKFFIGSRTPFAASVEEPKPGAATAGMKPGVYYIGSGFQTSLGNLSSLIIPLLISGTIILNTMLGSVFERKKEIAIYNAVGLNPNHIGMFFLSEAFVYSIVGSVGGYLIGQGMSIGLIALGVQGIDLNFSSLKVVYVILFTIAMVLLSTLYPAVVATRAAVPSGKRKWEFPEHDGHQMKLVFPFIYQPSVVNGVMGYLEEYFSRFTEASVGDLIANLKDCHRGRDAEGRETYTMVYDIALAPFDLGVTQQVTFIAAWDQRVQSYRIQMQNVRLSGQDTNWVTTNKPFLERLRTYLMHWRNLDAAEQALYANASTRVLADPPVLVAANEPQAAPAAPAQGGATP